MDLILQLWGGGFYFLNKVFFALAEGRQERVKKDLRTIGWVVYLLGVPAWVLILVDKHDWIAASIEAGGVPAMLFGLYNVVLNPEQPNRIFDRLTSFCTYGFLLLGVGYSLYDFGGLRTLTQGLEIGVMIGFLIGSYLLAKKHYYGWLFFLLMNGSMASLMLLQHKPLLAIQQLLSLCFVLYGFSMAWKTANAENKVS
jgi:nicotinamide riboside transporter PnuC